MEGTIDPAEGLEGKIQRTILLGLRTFHPKEGLVHMEEGSMLVEEGLFHPEEPLFLLWMAMLLPKEGTFLPGERSMLPKEAPILIEEGTVLVFQPPSLPEERVVLPREGPVHPGQGALFPEEPPFHAGQGTVLPSHGILCVNHSLAPARSALTECPNVGTIAQPRASRAVATAQADAALGFQSRRSLSKIRAARCKQP